MPVMVGIPHWRDVRALTRKGCDQQFVNLGELAFELVEQMGVVRFKIGSRSIKVGTRFDASGDVDREFLTPEFAVDHRPPKTDETFITTPARPGITRAASFFSVAQKFSLVVRVAVPLDLEPLVFAESGQQNGDLILKGV